MSSRLQSLQSTLITPAVRGSMGLWHPTTRAAAHTKRWIQHAQSPRTVSPRASLRPSLVRSRFASSPNIPAPTAVVQSRLAHSIPRPRQPQPTSSSTSPPPSEVPPGSSFSTTSSPPPSTDTPHTAAGPASSLNPNRVQLQPHYSLTFTCTHCSTRSSHVVSKQGYHHGSVLISCPGCRNRHVISDHLGVFTDRKGVTVEDFMREKGQLVKRGTVGEDGDVEFWVDDMVGEGDQAAGEGGEEAPRLALGRQDTTGDLAR